MIGAEVVMRDQERDVGIMVDSSMKMLTMSAEAVKRQISLGKG